MNLTMKRLVRFSPSIFLTLIFIVWTILVKTIDVSYIQNVGYLGFSRFNFQVNNFVFEYVNYQAFDKLSDIGLYLSFAVVLIFGIIGIVEWIKRKSIKKVDPILFVLLAIYVVTAFEYFVFEIAKINYSPLSTSEELHASYPSSHVLFFITFIGAVLVIMYAVLRLLSGQHYFTDIVAGLILSSSIIALFIALKQEFVKIEE
jgi:undecaprenyl-diphosphatase